MEARIAELEQRVAGFGVDASNSTAESVIGASTDMFKVFGTIRAQYCAAIGQTRFNNDFGRAHKELVHGQEKKSTRKKKRNTGAHSVGAFHKMSANAQTSLIRLSKERAMKHKALVDHYLEIQFDRKMDKMLEGR